MVHHLCKHSFRGGLLLGFGIGVISAWFLIVLCGG